MIFEYPKTPNLFARDPETHVVIRQPKEEFTQIATWLVTEKIDGTNIRLVLDTDKTISVRGRSDAAALPKNFEAEALGDGWQGRLLLALQTIEPEHWEHFALIVFGEGYGPGIQKGGGGYAPRKSLRIFDVVTINSEGRRLWRTWDDVKTVSEILGVPTAPVISWYSRMDTNEVIRYVKGDPDSVVAIADGGAPEPPVGHRGQEGVIARTDPYLFDYRGNRVMFKLKGKDLR